MWISQSNAPSPPRSGAEMRHLSLSVCVWWPSMTMRRRPLMQHRWVEGASCSNTGRATSAQVSRRLKSKLIHCKKLKEPIPKLHQPFAHMPLFSPTCVAARFINEDPWSDVEPKRKEGSPQESLEVTSNNCPAWVPRPAAGGEMLKCQRWMVLT